MSSITTLITRLQGFVNGGGNGFQVRYIQGSDSSPSPLSSWPLANSDRRLLCKAFKYMDDVVKQCQSPRLNLKNSPPFILDILPDTYSQLMFIFTQNNNVLRENEYLRIFLDNMQQKCKDLKAEFPSGNFIGDKFRITKREAEDFWQQYFPKKSIVPWSQFLQALETAHNYSMQRLESTTLKTTIDLTANDHISNFEFDVFTRLFYPWKTLLRNWQLLTTNHPGYVAFLTYDEVKKRLEKLSKKPGSYVFRLSCTRPGQWAIGYVAPDGKIYQTIPQNKSLIQALHEGSKEGFYMYPNGRDKDIDLSTIMEVPQADRVMVTSEQYELYCEMGTTFELCKICDDNEKNIKIEPCGHLLCSSCLSTWQDSENGNTCPFCRYEIKGTNRVIIDRFRPPKKEHKRSSVPTLQKISPPKPDPKHVSAAEVNLLLLDDLPVAPPPLPPRPTPRTNLLKKEHSYVNIKELLAEGLVLPVRVEPVIASPTVPSEHAPLPPATSAESTDRGDEYINTLNFLD
ncbi:unnamed protein product [Caenorhabditis auriculariae]|uniref:E3 ubiquitin-protein ligase CBL n=1 Tax=Caenorhabditis auriculariae TaxID=2777116 RepID=A0A8S1H125_9PELO|nr:unnamed protein product [Caenorhabditis auriculariae]